MKTSGWIGVDFDGTLAHYAKWGGDWGFTGPPVAAMVAHVRAWLAAGLEVRIFTARAQHLLQLELAVARGEPVENLPAKLLQARIAIRAVEEWSLDHIGVRLPVTCVKDHHCFAIVDDRAVAVEKNTGVLTTSPSLHKALLAELERSP